MDIKVFFTTIGFVGALFVFPSCLKTYKIAPGESPQGKEHVDKRDIVANNLRSVRVYDQWQTMAMFDVVWLSEETRRSYVDLYCKRRGKGEQARNEMLEKERKENEESISFYILADVRDQFHPSLADEHAAWTTYLVVEGKKIVPESVKEVELDPEIQSIFGHRFPRPKFKTPFLVKFSAKDGSIASNKPFKMVISSTTKECIIGWQGGNPVVVKNMKKEKKSAKRKLPKDEDYYWL